MAVQNSDLDTHENTDSQFHAKDSLPLRSEHLSNKKELDTFVLF